MEKQVIDAEILEDDNTLRGAPSYVEIPHRAAATLDAFAETVAIFDGDKARAMRDKAQALRSVSKNVETAAVAGGQFLESVKDASKKLGLRIELRKGPIAERGKKKARV
jgi:hypothetical protein